MVSGKHLTQEESLARFYSEYYTKMEKNRVKYVKQLATKERRFKKDSAILQIYIDKIDCALAKRDSPNQNVPQPPEPVNNSKSGI